MKLLYFLALLSSLSFGRDFFYEEVGRTAAEFMLYGISIGIVLMAAIYSLVLYRHNKKKNMSGTLVVSNTDQGALFLITF